MSEPFSFASESRNFSFPLLFSGQAQKEPFVNETFTMIDALLPRTINASRSVPPSSSSDGDSFLVLSPAAGDWAGQDDTLALRIAGAWRFIDPIEGMSVFDREAGQYAFYRSSWEFASEPSPPTGGSVVDVEARATVSHLIEVLRDAGVFADTTS